MKVGTFLLGLALAQDEATTTETTTIETTTTTTTTEATTTQQQEVVENVQKASEENIFIEIGDDVDISDESAVLDNVLTQGRVPYSSVNFHVWNNRLPKLTLSKFPVN